MREDKKCEVDYEEKMKIDASPQEILEAIFAAADKETPTKEDNEDNEKPEE